MRDLHVVALSDDGQHVILATGPDATRGGFRVAVDDRLRAVLRSAGADAGAAPSAAGTAVAGPVHSGPSHSGSPGSGSSGSSSGVARSESAPAPSAGSVPASPKEIQFRLRAGESVEQIAASSGMPLAKVERYAGPVLSERERVLEQVRNSFVGSVGRGSTEMRLGDVVDRRLADSVGVRPDSITWSARREPSGVWLVELNYVSH